MKLEALVKKLLPLAKQHQALLAKSCSTGDDVEAEVEQIEVKATEIAAASSEYRLDFQHDPRGATFLIMKSPWSGEFDVIRRL